MMMLKFHGALISDLLAAGRKITVAAPHSANAASYVEKLRSLGAHTVPLAMSRNGMNPASDFVGMVAMIRLMRRIRPDAVLVYTAKPVIYGLLAAKAAGVQRRIALITGLGYAFTGEAKGRRRVIHLILSNLYKFALRYASVVLFQNVDDQQVMQDIGLINAKTSSLVVDGCGVDTDYYSQSDVPSGPPCFLMVSRIIADKGVREFVEAAQIVRKINPMVHFRLVGGLDSNPDAISLGEVKSWVAQGLISWDGQIPDVRKALAESSVFVLPSYREGLPQSTIEALASGRAVITTDVPGCRETVINGETGFLIPPCSGAELAKACVHFINDPALASVFGEAAREVAEKRFSASRINAIVTRVIDE